MAKNINSLLKKKGWTGEEVGRALIASFLHDIKNSGTDYKPLFTQAEFNNMEDSLNTETDFIEYGVYRQLYSSLVESFNGAQAYYQQFYNGFYRNLMYLTQALNADKDLIRIESYPLTMTKKQYKDIVAETSGRLGKNETSYYSLIFNIVETAFKLINADRTKELPAPILKAIEATKEELADNERILINYCEDTEEGYYKLPDGRRSDKMPTEKWREALTEVWNEGHSLIVDGEPATTEETLKYFNKKRLLMSYKLFFEGAEDIIAEFNEASSHPIEKKDALELVAEAIEENKADAEKIWGNKLTNYMSLLTKVQTCWHYYTEAPEGLTKYDALENMTDRYSGVYRDRVIAYNGEKAEYTEEIPEEEQLEEFIADYPAVYKAVTEYINGLIPKAKALKKKDYFKDFISWGELESFNVIGFSFVKEPSIYQIVDTMEEGGNYSYTDTRRALYAGIAIITHPLHSQTDEKGYFIDASNHYNFITDIDKMATDDFYLTEIKELKESIAEPALSYLYAYNSVIDIIGRVYSIEDMEVAKYDLTTFESQIDAYNNLIYEFYFTVAGNEAEKKRKRKLIKKLFEPFNLERLRPNKEKEEELEKMLKSLGTNRKAREKLKDFITFVYLLDRKRGNFSYRGGIDNG